MNEAMIGSLIRDFGPMPDHVAAAVRTVPREAFVPDGYFVKVPASSPTAWRPVMPHDDEWRAHCYANEALVTQIAGTIAPRDIRGEIAREPTSSTSQPGLVTFTLDEADLKPGHRVLELGAGTGWQAGLLSVIVGEDHVFTLEADPVIACGARTNLYRRGLHPEVVEGDGRAGHPEGAPYDRLLATFGVARIYPAWLEQVKPGGIIIANLRSRLEPSGIARLVVNDDGTAHGRFISEGSYMPARQEAAPLNVMLPDPSTGRTRPTKLDPRTLHNNAAKLVAESVVTGVQWLSGLDVGDGPADWFIDDATGAFAVVHESDEGFHVMEDPERPFWTAIETAVETWRQAGQPETTRLLITADAHGHRIRFAED